MKITRKQLRNLINEELTTGDVLRVGDELTTKEGSVKVTDIFVKVGLRSEVRTYVTYSYETNGRYGTETNSIEVFVKDIASQ